MNKRNFFNVIDFGSSKIRLSTFDINFNEKFSDSINVSINEDFKNHFEAINKIIKKAEKKFSHHIEDIILTLDSVELFVINSGTEYFRMPRSFEIYGSLSFLE